MSTPNRTAKPYCPLDEVWGLGFQTFLRLFVRFGRFILKYFREGKIPNWKSNSQGPSHLKFSNPIDQLEAELEQFLKVIIPIYHPFSHCVFPSELRRLELHYCVIFIFERITMDEWNDILWIWSSTCLISENFRKLSLVELIFPAFSQRMNVDRGCKFFEMANLGFFFSSFILMSFLRIVSIFILKF